MTTIASDTYDHGMYVCMCDRLHVAEHGSTGYRSCFWSAEQGKWIFPCPCSRLRVWSRETSSAVLSRDSLLILHTQAESGAYSRDSSRFLRRHPFILPPYAIGSVPSFSVTQSRTDGIHCRESAETETVVLKVVSVTDVAFAGFRHGPIN